MGPSNIAAVLALAWIAQAGATQSPPANGENVVLRSASVQLKVGPRVVATGDVHRVFRVARRNGAWLWVEAPELAGWVKADDVLPFAVALQRLEARIAEGGGTAEDFNQRGLYQFELGRADLALQDFDQALRLDPEYATAYLNRGLAHRAIGETDRALADLDEAAKRARLDPIVYFNRAEIRIDRREYAAALSDLDLAHRVEDPARRNAPAWFNHIPLSLLVGLPAQAAADAQVYLRIAGWKESLSPYAALLGYTAARRADLPEIAAELLAKARAQCDPKSWPYPIFRHLAGEIDLDTLLSEADSESQKDEARLYAGAALEAAGEPSKAAELYRAVLRNADPNLVPHRLATAWLAPATPPPPAPLPPR